MTGKGSSNKQEKSSKGGSGTHGFAPLGYVEVAGFREALQKAADEITRLKKENELLKKQLKKAKHDFQGSKG